MAAISAQVSLYPIGQETWMPVIDGAIARFGEYNLTVTPSALNTLLSGEDDEVFRAIKEAFSQASASGPTIMVVTLANVLPEDVPVPPVPQKK